MVDKKKNLSGFTDLPGAIVDTDFVHVSRSSKDYRAPASKVLKTADVINDLASENEEKPPSAKNLTDIYNYSKWENRADGILFTFNSSFVIVRSNSDVTVTMPSGYLVDIDSAAKIPISVGTPELIPDGGGIVLNKDGSTISFDYEPNISTIIEGADLKKFVIAKNIGGILKSRIPSVENALYPEKTTVTDLSWDFDNAISDADPGVGEFRMNNATPANVTEIYFSKESKQTVDVTNVLLDISPGNEIQIIQQSNPLRYIIGTAGVIVDAVGYVKVPITITDNGTLFDTGNECQTSLFYEQKETASDITRNYLELAVSASVLSLDFATKAEVWATKVAGGAIVVNENITISRANDTNKKTDYTFISVTGAAREITLPAATVSSDSRWSSGTNKLTLDVGTYLIKRSYDGTNEFLTFTNGIPLAGSGVVNGGISASEQDIYGLKPATGTSAINGTAPVAIRIKDLQTSPSWTVGAEMMSYEFYSGDGSGSGVGVKAKISAIVEIASGAYVGMGFYVDNGTSLILAGKFNRLGNLLLIATPLADTTGLPALVRDASTGEVKTNNPAYVALTPGAAVAYSLITGLNKTLNVAVNTTITFSNMASRLGQFGTIRLNVTVSSDIVLAGATFKGVGNLTGLATGIYHIAFTVVSSTEIDYNINTTPYA